MESAVSWKRRHIAQFYRHVLQQEVRSCFPFSLVALAISAQPTQSSQPTQPSQPITWHAEFLKASLLAKEQKKDLVIHFRVDDKLDPTFKAPEVGASEAFRCVRLPIDYVYKGEKMIERAAVSRRCSRSRTGPVHR